MPSQPVSAGEAGPRGEGIKRLLTRSWFAQLWAPGPRGKTPRKGSPGSWACCPRAGFSLHRGHLCSARQGTGPGFPWTTFLT